VNGVKCQIYTVNDTGTGSTMELCVANGLPLRIVDKSSGNTITILLTDFDKVSDIKAPI
jgi:hypothetical protein